MSRDKRQHERFRVQLSVRFSKAVDFVTQYAENLSAGGLFVSGAQSLEILSDVSVDITLPGYGSHRVVARVAHILTDEMASRFGGVPGAGLEIVDAPAEFQEALRSYLQVLGSRRDVTVLASDPGVAGVLSEAGYHVRLVSADDIADDLGGAAGKVIAVVAFHHERDAYGAALAREGRADLLVTCEEGSDPVSLLGELDRRIGLSTS